MKILSLFSGIGAFEKALDNLGIPYELAGFSEIDKYAVKSYCAIHGVDESMNLGDITKIDEKALPKDIDLITYGFPCQDISLAGKQKGLFHEDGSQTRSGLFFEALRLIEAAQPRVAIAENVKNLTGKKFKLQFEIVLNSLEEAGYNNYWQVLNAKDYGIPQNRERVFVVSIRKDIDTGLFKFPQGFPLELRLKDMLEEEVEEKYYVNHAGVLNILSNFEETVFPINSNKQNIQAEPVRIGGLFDSGESKHQAGSVWDKESIAPTVDTMQSGYRQPLVLVREATKKGYAVASEGDFINFEQPNSKTRRGRVGKQVAQTLTTSPKQGVVIPPFVNDDICKTVRASGHGSVDRHSWDMVAVTEEEMNNLRIRKLTPKECFRLMGFDDEDFAKAEAVNSNTQLYKQAGNSIVVPVIENIYKELINAKIMQER